MRTIDSSPSVPAKVYGFEVLMGFGFGMLFSTTTVLIKFHADQGDSGIPPPPVFFINSCRNADGCICEQQQHKA